MNANARARAAGLLTLLLLPACGAGSSAAPPSAPGPEAITNRIDLPSRVVESLGITFVRARRGRLEQRMDVPGRLVVPPGAQQVIRAPVSGRVHLPALAGAGAPVAPWTRVAAGAVVAELRGPELEAFQARLGAVEAEVRSLAIEEQTLRQEARARQTLLAFAEQLRDAARGRWERARAQVARVNALLALADARRAEVERLSEQNALGRGTLVEATQAAVDAARLALEAQDDVEFARAELTRVEAEAELEGLRLARAQAELDLVVWKHSAAALRLRTAEDALAALVGVDGGPREGAAGAMPWWTDLAAVPLRAGAGGVVRRVRVAEGAHVQAGDPLIEIADVSTLWFEGRIPEADAARIPDAALATVRVVGRPDAPIEVAVRGPHPLADEASRMLWLHAPVPNPDGSLAAGVTAVASVLVDRAQGEEVLVPVESVARDGLEHVVFVRVRDAADQVVRLPVSVGRRNREWIEVLSDVMEGDELVLDGVHELREASAGKTGARGHFHADGTWHEDHK